MSDKVSKTIAQYKEFKQLQEYACAQETTILQMSKKIQTLEEKLKHSEVILKNAGPAINSIVQYSKSDSEDICKIEIAKLKSFTIERELTYEEVKKLDIYYKVLNNINSKPHPEKEAEQLPTDNLLKIVESENKNSKS
jgi:hypothetical protein